MKGIAVNFAVLNKVHYLSLENVAHKNFSNQKLFIFDIFTACTRVLVKKKKKKKNHCNSQIRKDFLASKSFVPYETFLDRRQVTTFSIEAN